VDGTDNHKILNDAIDAVWAPLGNKIAYKGAWDGQTALIVADPDGSNPVPVAFGLIEPHPDWSPDGTRIAYVKVICTSRCGYDVWSVRADGTDERQLTFTDNQERGVSWSPDRSKIAFLASDPELSGGAGIFTMNPDGGGITKLRDDGGFPFWRPFINRRPDCSGVTASPGSLWPPNHKLVRVTLAGASDPDGDAVTLVVTGVSSDPPAGPSDARTGPGQNQARVRAVRGRTYEIAFDVGDDAGAHCFGTVSVAVTHG
jgi:dipeptidyl aminopeptidase/acylaminoacyl peptidase